MSRINKRSQVTRIEDTDFSDAVSTSKFTSAETESDFVSFADAAAGGGRDYAWVATLAQDAATGTLWDYAWAHAGEEVEVELRPYGNATPTVAQPHFVGTAVVQEPDGDFLGGDADASTTAVQVIEVTWPLIGKPNKVTA